MTQKQRQAIYRQKLKDEMGNDAYKAEQAKKMRDYRQSKKANTQVEETKISNKETRNKVNQLLKTIEERVLGMIKEQKANPNIQIEFEDFIKPSDITPILLQINNDMTNEQVVNAFTENEIQNPRNKKVNANKKTFIKYLDTIQRLRRIYFNIKDTKVKVYHDFDWLKDTEKVIKIITEKYSNPNSLSTMMNAISATLGRLAKYQDVYLNTYKNLNIALANNKKQIQLEKENQLTPQEKNSFMEWNDILNLEQKIKESNPENLAIYYIYTQIPPRRVGDYSSLIIQQEGPASAGRAELEDSKADDNNQNFVILNNKRNKVQKIILNQYKTAKKYGQYIIEPVPSKLSKAIIDLIKEKGIKNGEYLFQNSNGKPYGESFSFRIKKLFIDITGKGITVNTLRHSFISHHLQGKVSDLKKAQYAKQMAHSTLLQSEYQRWDSGDEE